MTALAARRPMKTDHRHLKACPGCDFRAGVAARACPSCGHEFPDAPSPELRRLAREHARRLAEALPRGQVLEALEDALRQDPAADQALAALEARRGPPAGPSLLGWLRVALRRAAEAWRGQPPRDRAVLRNAALEAFDDLPREG